MVKNIDDVKRRTNQQKNVSQFIGRYQPKLTFYARQYQQLVVTASGLFIILLFLMSLDSYAQQTKVVWKRIGELPDGTGGADQHVNLGVAGPFVGVHNNALIVAGGANFPIPKGHQLWDRQTRKVFYNTIWTATQGDGEIAGNERELTWHDTQLKLPGDRAYGSSASHALGVFVIGGSDGVKGYNDVYLLRWNTVTKQPELYTLPALPTISVDGGATIIANTLYVMAGSNGKEPSADLYSLDLSLIKTDINGNPIANNGVIEMSIQPWQQQPSLPQSEGENMARTHMVVVAQNNGINERVYVIGGRRNTTIEQHPNAVPVLLGENRIYFHMFSDVWEYNPKPHAGERHWSRRADISVDGKRMGLSAGTGIALGQSNILILAGSNGDNLRKAFGEMKVGWSDFPNHPGFYRKALSYSAINNSWSTYNDAPLMADPIANHLVAANAVTTTATLWGNLFILASGEVRPKIRSPNIWAITVDGSEASLK